MSLLKDRLLHFCKTKKEPIVIFYYEKGRKYFPDGFGNYINLEVLTHLYKHGVNFRVYIKKGYVEKLGQDITEATLKNIAKYYYIDKLNEEEVVDFLNDVLFKKR